MHLEFVEGSSKKFWEATLDGAALKVRWGRLGTAGQEETHTFKTAKEAREEHDALVQQKTKKGYVRTDAPKEPPREPNLEAAMFASLASDKADAALVYADWLQSHGNPWGELITVQYAREKRPKDKALQKREQALLSALPLPDPKLGTVTWRRGCIDALHLFNEQDWMDDAYDVMVVLRPVLDLPHCGGLRELRTGVIRWDANTEDVPAVLAEAAKRPLAKYVRRLFLGDIPTDVDMDHHVIGDVRALSKQFPNLESLKLHSGAARWRGRTNFEFGPLKLPKLASLIIETCGLSSGRAKQLTASVLPALEELEVWCGSKDYGANATAKDLLPVLTAFPTVTRLGLKNNEFTDELVAPLVKSPLAPRLKSLDLSLGVLSSEGVKVLVANAAKFASLEVLDVSESYLSRADVKALKKAFPRVELEAGEQKTLEDDFPERYVSVHE